jgi:peroxiredoxin
MKILRVLLWITFIFAFALVSFGQKAKTLAENFSAVSLEGNSVELESLKGKVVVLTFWSTRCAICHSEIPKLNRLAENYRGKNVVFLGITMDNDAKVEAYLQKNPFNFNILPNSFGVFYQYADKDTKGNMNMGFPAHFLINQTGEIEIKASGFDKTEQLNAGISRLLNSNLAKAE